MARRGLYTLILGLAPALAWGGASCARPADGSGAALMAGVASVSGAAPSPGVAVAPRPSGSAEAWVDTTLERLPLRRKVAQLVVPWMDGSYLAAGSPAYERLREWVEGQGVGGVIVSVGPPLEVAAKLNMLQELADVPLAPPSGDGDDRQPCAAAVLPVQVAGSRQVPASATAARLEW